MGGEEGFFFFACVAYFTSTIHLEAVWFFILLAFESPHSYAMSPSRWPYHYPPRHGIQHHQSQLTHEETISTALPLSLH